MISKYGGKILSSLSIEEWMVDDSFWGIEKKASFVAGEEPESTMEIEAWMYDN
jgi:hypothetical protein